MHTMDTLRNNLYDEFKPQIQTLPELQIEDGFIDNTFYPLVATKKVTQIKVPSSTLLQDTQQDNPEILPIEQDNKQVVVLDLPPVGPVVKQQIDVDSIVYIMKHPLMPWIKGKVVMFFMYIVFIRIHILLGIFTKRFTDRFARCKL